MFIAAQRKVRNEMGLLSLQVYRLQETGLFRALSVAELVSKSFRPIVPDKQAVHHVSEIV